MALVSVLARDNHWARRQTFVLLCGALSSEEGGLAVLASKLMPPLLLLAGQPAELADGNARPRAKSHHLAATEVDDLKATRGVDCDPRGLAGAPSLLTRSIVEHAAAALEPRA